MSSQGINRRRFLQTSGVIIGAAALGTGTVSLLVPRTGWSVELLSLDEHEARTLLEVIRQIFPHASLADMYYATVVRDLDDEADGDPAIAQLLKEGIAALDKAMGIRWIDLSDGNRRTVLTAMSDSAFFGKVKGKAVVSLYNNPLVWRHFGYEGASYPFGGYIQRGFNDLTWLPDPPAEASPPAADN